MENKELALRLSQCESDVEVLSVLKEIGVWDDSRYWRTFGDMENNWSTIGNQQSEPEAALVEKIVNSIDAMLMKECLIRGISPESSDAPKSIAEAMETYFNIKGGKLQDISQTERTKLAQQIIFAASGDKPNENTGSPCITIVDSGEGQSPKRMPDTILSINKANKLKVPFVQGKFNVGGTGVISFCGENCFQLIICKRCPEISSEKDEFDETAGLWGFTITRRELPTEGSNRRTSMITYLVGLDNNVRSFNADDGIEVIPTSKNNSFRTMTHGMYCKMFDFKMPSRLCSNINMNLYYRLSVLLPNLAYPVLLDECREYKAHTMFRTLSGLNVRLSDHSGGKEVNNVEDKLSASFNIDGQKISVAVFVFKKTTEKGTEVDVSQFRADEGILLTYNGQTHGNFDRRFYRKSSVGLSYIADHILTIVDCSLISEATHEDLFMNSRDRMRIGNFKKKLENALEEFLKENETLKQIQNRRRAEAIADKLDDEKPLEEVLSSVFKVSSVLSKLFLFGERLQNPMNIGEMGSSDKYIGKYNPTFFTIAKKTKDNIFARDAQIGRKFKIKFKTDAVNDFFSREDYPGSYILQCGTTIYENHWLDLHNGTAILTIPLPDDAQQGDKYKFRCIIIDTNTDNEFINEFEISAVPQIESGGSGKGEQSPPGQKGNKTKSPKGITLPNVLEVKRDGWEEHQFTKESALKVVRAAADTEAFDFFINIENIHLQTEVKPFAKDELKMKIYKARYKYAMVLIGLSILSYRVGNEMEETPEELVRLYTEMVSPVILPMIEVMGSDMSDIIGD